VRLVEAIESIRVFRIQLDPVCQSRAQLFLQGVCARTFRASCKHARQPPAAPMGDRAMLASTDPSGLACTMTSTPPRAATLGDAQRL
jgi:hypothetical protein